MSKKCHNKAPRPISLGLVEWAQSSAAFTPIIAWVITLGSSRSYLRGDSFSSISSDTTGDSFLSKLPREVNIHEGLLLMVCLNRRRKLLASSRKLVL